MNELRDPPADSGELDLGEYCRRVEEHLARANGGHLVRVFGQAFELVRRWYLSAVPLSIVVRGIQDKADRHRVGRSKRPLRLEFCESDVESLFADWRRAVGVTSTAADDVSTAAGRLPERPRTFAPQLDRAIDKLVRIAGRLDVPEDIRAEAAVIIDRLAALRDAGRRARGEARKVVVEQAAAIDRELGVLARRWAGEMLAEVVGEAERELAVYRQRLSAVAWARTVETSVDRLLRERLGVPTLDGDGTGPAWAGGES